MQGKWARLFLQKDELKVGRNWCKLGEIGGNWRKLKRAIFAIFINFRQFLQFPSIFANFFGGLIGHYLFNRNSATFGQIWANLQNFGEKQQKIQRFLTEILRSESGAKEGIL